MMKSRCKHLLPILFCVFAAAIDTPAYCWGRDVHRIIATATWQMLDPATKKAIIELLKNDPSSAGDPATAFVDLSNWADESLNTTGGDGTAGWHFTDIPLEAAKDYDLNALSNRPQRFTLGPDGTVLPQPVLVPATDNSSVHQVRKALQLVSDPQADAARRALGLKFLIHLTADLHCPVHNISWHADKGGNLRPVKFFGVSTMGGGKPLNLHSLWDWGIAEEIAKRSGWARTEEDGRVTVDIEAFAKAVASNAAADSKAFGTLDEIRDWSWEAHQQAAKIAYTGFDIPIDWRIRGYGSPPDANFAELGEEYFKKAEPVVMQGMRQSAVRLARLVTIAVSDLTTTFPCTQLYKAVGNASSVASRPSL